jgi:hypothetical protein
VFLSISNSTGVLTMASKLSAITSGVWLGVGLLCLNLFGANVFTNIPLSVFPPIRPAGFDYRTGAGSSQRDLNNGLQWTGENSTATCPNLHGTLLGLNGGAGADTGVERTSRFPVGLLQLNTCWGLERSSRFLNGSLAVY